MVTASLSTSPDPHTTAVVRREAALQRLVMVYIATGLLFMLLPGARLSAQLGQDRRRLREWPAPAERNPHQGRLRPNLRVQLFH